MSKIYEITVIVNKGYASESVGFSGYSLANVLL